MQLQANPNKRTIRKVGRLKTMPVYLDDLKIKKPTKIICGPCGATLTVVYDSTGHRIVGPCQRCADAKKREDEHRGL